jgi:hypothetical protein
MVRDPRRLYAHGRLYHIVERKPFRYEFATLFNLLISIIIVFIAFRCLCTNSIIVNRCRIKVFVSIIVLAFPVQVPVNWTNDTLGHINVVYNPINKLPISNVSNGSKRCATNRKLTVPFLLSHFLLS